MGGRGGGRCPAMHEAPPPHLPMPSAWALPSRTRGEGDLAHRLMEWTDDAIVLSTRPYGESSLVVQLLTREHGRHAGLAKGAQRGKARAAHQPGNRVRATWK